MSNAKIRSGVLMLVLAMAFCGSLYAADDVVHVIPNSDLEHWWVPPPGHPNPPPQYPLDALKAGVEGCVAVAFEIQSDGSVSNVRVWHSDLTNLYPRKEVEQAALIATTRWHFVPAPANTTRAPVYTYEISTFTLSNSPLSTKSDQQHQKEVKAKCEVPDFAQQVKQMISAEQQNKSK